METKFSKGEWKLSNHRTKKGYYAKIDAPGWGDFARVVVRMTGEESDSGEGVANAKLIAAAPDMFEAIQILLGDIERSPICYTREEKIEIARKAIKKATE